MFWTYDRRLRPALSLGLWLTAQLSRLKWSDLIAFFLSLPLFVKPRGISEEVFRQLETVQNRYDSSTAAAFRAVQKSGEMVVRTLDPRQFIRLASETAPKINIDTNVRGYDSYSTMVVMTI